MSREDRQSLPASVREFVNGTVHDMRLPARLREGVRGELLDHFEDALADTTDEGARRERAQSLLEEFGDSHVLAKLIRRGKNRCKEAPTMNLSGILGLCLVAFFLVFAIATGGFGATFINVPSLIFAAWISAALGIMSFGLQDFLRAVWSARALLVGVSPERVSSRSVTVLRGLIPVIYASGGIGVIVGIIQMLATMDDPSQIGAGLAVSLICPFYAMLIAECIVRPALRVLENQAHDPAPGPPASTDETADVRLA